MAKLFPGVTRNVVVLGFVSFFTDLASEMLYPIIPLFLTGVLGVDKQLLGILEGLAEGLSTGLRWIGGVLSDLASKRKPFVLVGYTLSAFSKPVMGLAEVVGGWPLFLAGRASDRLGKSIRTAARDALIADATPAEHRGSAFGLHRTMDTAGAVVGPLSALAILYLAPAMKLGWLFLIALAPGAVSSLLVALFVRDVPHTPSATEARAKAHFWQHYPPAFWHLLLANALFSLGNSSDSLLIVRGTDMAFGPGTTFEHSRLLLGCGLFAAFNVIYGLVAAPMGRLSDALGRKPVIMSGWLIYALVYLGFAFGAGPVAPWVLFAAYGLYQAFAEGVTKALVSDLVDQRQRAGAIGLFYTVSGLGQLFASAGAGILWEHVGVEWAFGLGTICALAAIPVIATVRVPLRSAA